MLYDFERAVWYPSIRSRWKFLQRLFRLTTVITIMATAIVRSVQVPDHVVGIAPQTVILQPMPGLQEMLEDLHAAETRVRHARATMHALEGLLPQEAPMVVAARRAYEGELTYCTELSSQIRGATEAA